MKEVGGMSWVCLSHAWIPGLLLLVSSLAASPFWDMAISKFFLVNINTREIVDNLSTASLLGSDPVSAL